MDDAQTDETIDPVETDVEEDADERMGQTEKDLEGKTEEGEKKVLYDEKMGFLSVLVSKKVYVAGMCTK